MNNFNYLFRFIIVGDTSVGKSCLLLQFTDKLFKYEHEATIGVEFGSRTVGIRTKQVKLQVWDTAGQESFKSITRSYYRGAIGALLVYDVTKKSSFDNVLKWLEETRTYASDKMVIVLVGNKVDIDESRREVTYDEGQNFALQYNLLFYETSAKNGQNVDEAFYKSAESILDKLEKGELDPTEHQGIKMAPRPAKEIDPNTLSRNKCC